MMLLRLSWREFRRRPLRALLTLLSIVIGVAAVLAVSLAIDNARYAQQEMLRAVAGQTTFEITAEGAAAFDDDLLAELRKIPSLRVVTGVVRRYSVLFFGDKQNVRVQYLGVDPKLDQEIREYTIVAGEAFNDYDQLLIDEGFARSLQLKLGDSVRFSTTSGLKEAVIVGFVKPKSGSAATQGGLVIVPLPTAQRWARATRKVDIVQIIADDKADKSQLLVAIQKVLPEGLKVREPILKSELGEESTVALDNGLGMASAFSFLIGIFIIYNTFQMNVGERRRQLGILRALGMTRSQIVAMILGEGVAMGLIGTVLGWMLGLLAASWLTQATGQVMDIDITGGNFHSLFPFLISGGCGLAVAFFGSYFPARRASFLRPAEALRVIARGELEPNHHLLLIVGVILSPLGFAILVLCVLGKIHIDHAIMGCFLFLLGYILIIPSFLPSVTRFLLGLASRWFGVEAELAQRQLVRHRVRSSLTIGILFIAMSTGLGMSCTILDNIENFRTWSSEVLVGDFFVRASMPSLSTGQAADIPEDFFTKIKELKDIQSVDTAKYTPGRAQELAVIVIARTFISQGRKIFHITHGDPQAIFAGLAEGKVVIGSVLAERAKLHVGDSLSLETITGIQEIPIVGIANDYVAAGLTVYMNRERAEELLKIEGINLAIVDAVPGQATKLKGELERVCAEDGLLVHSQTELLEIVRSKVDGLVGGLWAILGLCSVIAAFGLINTLTMNILEQTAEIGMLRAVAMTRKQVRRMILSQAFFMAVVGLVPAVIAGLLIAYLLALSVLPTTGHAIEFQLRPGLIMGSLAVEFLIVLIASILPAERAARIPVRQAMQY